MSHHDPRRQVMAGALGVALAALAFGSPAGADYKMLQNTTIGWVTAGNRVDCNASGGFAHWNVRDISWKHNTANQGAGKETALKNAMATWTNVANATYQLNYDGTTTAGFGADGVNSISWGGTFGCGGCIALAGLNLQSGQVIVETDVVFNNGPTWTTNGNQYDTESVAAHEFGHTLGLHHASSLQGPQTMSDGYFGTGMRSLHADDIAGLQCSESRYPAVCSGTPPARPPTASVTPGYCFGSNTATWSASAPCPVTKYEVWGSTSASFTSPFLIYSGTGTSTPVTVTQSQNVVYVWVRSCTGSLCGFYRWAGQAIYYSGCCINYPC